MKVEDLRALSLTSIQLKEDFMLDKYILMHKDIPVGDLTYDTYTKKFTRVGFRSKLF